MVCNTKISFLGRSLQTNSEDIELQSGINQSVAMAIAGTSMFGIKTTSTDRFKLFQQVL